MKTPFQWKRTYKKQILEKKEGSHNNKPVAHVKRKSQGRGVH